jgi:NitT/TauT family transport system ATP-binding protein
MVNLGPSAEPGYELSGGMKQRALAPLAVDPAILLLDEPFGALDASRAAYDELQELWMRMGKTVVFVTHNVREAVVWGRVLVFTLGPDKSSRSPSTSPPAPHRHAGDSRANAESPPIAATHVEPA